MNKLYYNPLIEEFYIGFAYETYNSELHTWENKVIKDSEHLCYLLFNSNNTTWLEECKDVVRVKYLDKEDIESLGFSIETESSETKEFFYNFGKEDYTLEYFNWFVNGSTEPNIPFDYSTATEYRKVKIKNKEGQFTVFNGTIKNKSELKILLKRLGINE